MRYKKLRKRSNKPGPVLHAKAWKVFSEYIRKRDGGKCCTCPSVNHWKDCNAGHFKHNKLDFDEMNINCQCVSCNKWNHGRLDRYASFLIGKYGLEAFEDLNRRAEIVHKYLPWELEAIITKYTAKINELATTPQGRDL
jgi:hypothetical protein